MPQTRKIVKLCGGTTDPRLEAQAGIEDLLRMSEIGGLNLPLSRTDQTFQRKQNDANDLGFGLELCLKFRRFGAIRRRIVKRNCLEV